MKEIDKLARELGFDRAEYVGKANGFSVYIGTSSGDGDEPALTGLPLFITKDKDGKLDYDFGFKFMYLIKE